MSHELIANSQGIIEAAFRVEPAWHGLGAVMGEDTSYEEFGKAAGNGSMNDASRGTAFGMLQAMTEYYDHHCQARSDENRFISGQYGTNATRKTDAYEALAAMVNAA